ncbi:helix-turn-helix domain-containing protein [Dactylosporangium sp. NPDC050688]|uniref:AraC-like ligand-binding domain-containing protein n=1 Tax=Dactylosporangium sp. NPDC050688 TaxID=3157217 RepID=UPI0033CA8EFF
MLNRYTVDTTKVRPDERFDYYQHLVGSIAAPATFSSPYQDNFVASAEIIDLGGVHIASMTNPPLDVVRTSRQVAAAAPLMYQLAWPIAGRSLITQRRASAALEPADFTLLDLSQQYEGKHDDLAPGQQVRSVSVLFPHSLLPTSPDKVRTLLATPLHSRDGLGALLAQDLRHIAGHPDQFQPADAGFLGRRLVDLIAATVAQLLGAGDTLPGEIKRRTMRTRISAFIDAHLSDPSLSVPAVAAAHNISARELYRLFNDSERPVAEEIRFRRLDRCRQDLMNPLTRERPIYAIARTWGFTHPELFSRQFKRVFGMSPSECRASTATPPTPPEPPTPLAPRPAPADT